MVNEDRSVSILLSCFKADSYVEDYIDSLLGNNYVDNIELVAINFPFSHESPEVVEFNLRRFPNLKLVNMKENITLYSAWNFAIKISETEFVANLNLDDRVSSDYYEYAVSCLRNYDADIFSSFAVLTDKVGISLDSSFREILLSDKNRFNDDGIATYSVEDLFVDNGGRIVKRSIPHCAPVWRRSLHKKLGYFNPHEYDFGADAEFWARCSVNGAKMLVSNTYRTIFYCASGTASDRLMFPRNETIIDSWKDTFPPFNYKSTHLGERHDLIHHCINMKILFSNYKYYAHLLNNSFVEYINSNQCNGIVPHDSANEPPRIANIEQSILNRARCFKDIHLGKKALLLCNGPSLNKVDFSKINLSEYIVFGLNKIYLGIDRLGLYPDYVASVNPKVVDQASSELASLPIPKFISNRAYHPALNSKVDENTYHLRTTPLPKKHCRFSTDITDYVHEGWTVTHVALQILYYMGVSEVNIVGMDHRFKQHVEGQENHESVIDGKDVDHFDPSYFGNGQKWDFPDLENSEISYREALKEYVTDGRSIYDCTIDGACSVFPKKDISCLYSYCQSSSSADVTVVIPAYNAESTIEECLESVLSQEGVSVDIVVVDDGSSDETCNIVRGIIEKDSRVSLINNRRTKGVSGARNTGLDISKGEYVTFLDSDDYYFKGSLLERKKLLDVERDLKVSFCGLRFVDCAGKSLDCETSMQTRIDYSEFYKCPLQMTAPLFKRSAISEIRFREDLSNGEDFHFLSQVVFKHGPFLGTGKVGVAYRVHKSSVVVGNYLKHVKLLESAFELVYSDYHQNKKSRCKSEWPELNNVLEERRFAAAVYAVVNGLCEDAKLLLRESRYCENKSAGFIYNQLKSKIPFIVMRSKIVPLGKYQEKLNLTECLKVLQVLNKSGEFSIFLRAFYMFIASVSKSEFIEHSSSSFYDIFATYHYVKRFDNTWSFDCADGARNLWIASMPFPLGVKGKKYMALIPVVASDDLDIRITIARQGPEKYEGLSKVIKVKKCKREELVIEKSFTEQHRALKLQLEILGNKSLDIEIETDFLNISETAESFQLSNPGIALSVSTGNYFFNEGRYYEATDVYLTLFGLYGLRMYRENLILIKRRKQQCGLA
jgi:glycosyltransferase involved in cell wall biosynthesis